MSLRVEGLHVAYRTAAGPLQAVRGLDLAVPSGLRCGLVGESGSGKTTVVSALLGLLPATAQARGTVRLGDDVLDVAAGGAWRGVRGRRIAVVPQGAMAGLHPAHRVVAQVAECVGLHTGAERGQARRTAGALLVDVGLDAAAARAFPHQLSGGMRQRVALAAALASRPEVLIADEPTVGLDAVVAARFLDLLRSRQAEDGFGLLVVSHDLSAVRTLCDDVHVVYAGRVVESGSTARVISRPVHPYAAGLVAAAPALGGLGWAAVPGSAPALVDPPAGCAFAPRCPHRHDRCTAEEPALQHHGTGTSTACHLVGRRGDGGVPPTTFPTTARRPARPEGPAVVEVAGLSKAYRSRQGLRRRDVQALQDVALTVRPGEVVGLVGASGSGKSTLARVLLGLVEADTGSVVVDGVDVRRARGRVLRALRHRLALVHQDPYGALHPAMTVAQLVAEPLAVDGTAAVLRPARVAEALGRAGLDATTDLLARRAGQLSGGQRQRVALARGLVGRPVLLVLDEPMSMLDASLRAGIARTLLAARDEVGLAVLVVTHDLAEAAATCDRLVVLDAGRVVESGHTEALVAAPAHPVTRRMLALAGAASGPQARHG